MARDNAGAVGRQAGVTSGAAQGVFRCGCVRNAAPRGATNGAAATRRDAWQRPTCVGGAAGARGRRAAPCYPARVAARGQSKSRVANAGCGRVQRAMACGVQLSIATHRAAGARRGARAAPCGRSVQCKQSAQKCPGDAERSAPRACMTPPRRPPWRLARAALLSRRWKTSASSGAPEKLDSRPHGPEAIGWGLPLPPSPRSARICASRIAHSLQTVTDTA